jgi:HTH-type transcriptional regulator / antitoxin MqsA
MKCVFCGGKVEKKKVTFLYDEDDKYILVANVPAEVCTKCGEKMYSPQVTDELLRFAKRRSKPVKTIQVPVFEFQKKAEAQ